MTTRGARVQWAAAVLALTAWVSATSVAVGAVAIVDGQLWLYTGDGNGGAVVSDGPGCGDVVIPSQVDCYPVTAIGSNAFYGCTQLTSVTVPNSVQDIGSQAFFGCSGLVDVTIPNSVTNIGRSVFSGCNGLQTLCVPLALSGTAMVSDSGVPSTCTVLYGDAWERVDGEAWSYVVSNGQATVTAGPRNGIANIPSSLGGFLVTAIGDYAFYRCSSLTAVTIPDSVTKIGWAAFAACNNLTAVHISNLATWCGIDFFDGANSNPLYYAKHLYLNGEEVTNLMIPNGVTSIGNFAFYYYSELTTAVIPDSVTNIGNYAFSSCHGLTNIVIGNGVTSIGDYAFSYCTNLPTVTIPDNVVNIGSNTFYDCNGLTNVWIGNGVTNLGPRAFAYCQNLEEATILGNLANSYSTWYEWSSYDGSSYYRSSSPFFYCSKLSQLTLDGSLQQVPAYCFVGLSNLNSVSIGRNVTSIGDGAFERCSGLEAVHISDLDAWCGISFGDWASNPLYYAKHLYLNDKEVAGDLVIPNGLTSIGQYAFYCCSNLTSVAIPNSVTNIGNAAFYGCNGLTAVHISDIASWCALVWGDDHWDNPNPLSYARHLYLNGEEVAGDLVIPNGVTRICKAAFYYCTNITTVVIPDSVTNIGNSAFYYCRGLTNIVIGNEVTSVGEYAFSSCTNLTSVTIPDSVTSIGYDAFSSCHGLTNIVIGNGVTSIGDYAFSYCTNLTTVTIPNSVTNIGTNSFYQYMGWDYFDSIEKYGRLSTMYVPESWNGKYVNGTRWQNYAGVPPGCEIIYYTPEEPAVTATGVPHGWLEENAGEALAAAGGDYEAAARAKAANGREMWECYVAGLSTTNAGEEFTTEISFSNGVPKVSWEPDLNEGGKKNEREYVVEGKPGMMEEWGTTNSESRFFRVKVEMP